MGWLSDVGKSIVGSSGKILGSALGVAGGLFGSSLDRSYRTDQWNNEYNAQKEFAQNGIRWRVADAKAAGIHPLAALGAQTASYSPQAVSHSNYAQTLADMGQNIGRAIGAKMTPDERQAANLQREGLELDNEFKRAQIENVRSQTVSRQMEDVVMMARASETAVNSQGLPPSMPYVTRSSGSSSASSGSMAEPIYMTSFLISPFGQRVSITNSGEYHDSQEDVPVLELAPSLSGMSYDAVAKITRKPVHGHDGKWYAWNGDEYAEVNIKTYKPWWKRWFRNSAPKIEATRSGHKPKSGGIRAFYGG